MKPIFLLSIPRSGSTLLQRMLASAENVATTSESWFLLHILAQMKGDGVYSIYSSQHAKRAMDDFIKVNIGQEKFKLLTREYINSVFSIASNNNEYFLEKTPRNSFYIDELFGIYDDHAKYVILFRNPLAVAMSMMDTWGGGSYNLYSYMQDFEVGLKNLISVCNDGRVISLKYEDFILGDVSALEEYLGFSIGPGDDLKVLEGRMGDPTGQGKYSKVESARSEAWAKGINTLTKSYCLSRLAKKIGREAFEQMGYSYEDSILKSKNIENYSFKIEVVDFFRYIYGILYIRFQPFLVKDVLFGKLLGALR